MRRFVARRASLVAAVAAAVIVPAALGPRGARAEEYVLGPDSQPQPGVPRGEVTQHSWTSRIFPGTVRDYWVYVPKQYDGSRPAAVMVFQDGANYIKEDGNWRVPVVFDNLIHGGEMPVTVGIFINPGVVPAASEDALPRFNRSFEYDSVSDRYARFLLEEVLPEALRWLWRDYPAAVAPAGPSKQPLMSSVLLPDEGWREAGRGHGLADAPAVNAQGEMFFADVSANRIHRVGLDGVATVFREGTSGARSLAFGPDGRLFAAQAGRHRIVAYGPDGRENVVAEGVDAHDLVLDHRGRLYATDPAGKRLWLVGAQGHNTPGPTEIAEPTAVVLSPDETLLYVTDRRGPFVWSFQVKPDGTLADGQAYYHLHLVEGEMDSGADGLAVDANGNLYISTRLGIQFCDQAGRMNGIVTRPAAGGLGRVAIGGTGRDELFVGGGAGLYRRKLRVRGVLAFAAPVKPNPPRL
jgi:sugar lactone lactonase YvrE